jgi:hypothetical protein
MVQRYRLNLKDEQSSVRSVKSLIDSVNLSLVAAYICLVSKSDEPSRLNSGITRQATIPPLGSREMGRFQHEVGFVRGMIDYFLEVTSSQLAIHAAVPRGLEFHVLQVSDVMQEIATSINAPEELEGKKQFSGIGKATKAFADVLEFCNAIQNEENYPESTFSTVTNLHDLVFEKQYPYQLKSVVETPPAVDEELERKIIIWRAFSTLDSSEIPTSFQVTRADLTKALPCSNSFWNNRVKKLNEEVVALRNEEAVGSNAHRLGTLEPLLHRFKNPVAKRKGGAYLNPLADFVELARLGRGGAEKLQQAAKQCLNVSSEGPREIAKDTSEQTLSPKIVTGDNDADS